MLDPAQLIGTLIDNRYRLTRFLGNGAFGYVFAADEIVLGQFIAEVAVKLIRPPDDRHRQDVLREVAAMAQLSSLYLLNYRSAGEVCGTLANGCLYLASELARGSLLDRLENAPPMGSDEARQVARDVACALAYLDERKAVHRDVKPANLLLVGDTWKLADFGLARPFAGSWMQASRAMGTLAYMSPEAIDGEIGAHVDVWAFGVLLQQCCGGDFPYDGASELQFIRNVAAREPSIMPGLPQPFDAIVRGCLTKNWRTRWTARQVLDALNTTSSSVAPPTVIIPTTVVTPPAVLPIAPAAAPAARRPALQTQAQPIGVDDLLVMAGGGGTHPNLTEAVLSATPGARIFIGPGIYRESIVLDKPLQLIGQGPRENIIVESGAASCLKMQAVSATVRGLTLRGCAGAAGKKHFAVKVAQGNLTLEDCAITSDSLACVAVQGATANATLRGCKIHDGASDGVLFFEGATGLIETCEISNHQRAGVHIKKGAAPLFRDCVIRGNKASGVVITDNGQGSIEGCDINDNAKAGVQIGQSGAPAIRRCKIRQNKQQAISADRTASGIIENCDLSDNKFGAWDIASGSLIERRSNKEL